MELYGSPKEASSPAPHPIVITTGAQVLGRGDWAFGSLERQRCPTTIVPSSHLPTYFLGLTLTPVTDYRGSFDGVRSAVVLQPGEFTLGAKGTYGGASWSGPIEFLNLVLRPDILSLTMNFEGEITPRFQQKDEVIKHLMLALWADIAEQHPAGALLGDAILQAIAARLVSTYAAQGATPLVTKACGAGPIRRALEYIHAHLGTPELNVTAIAEASGLSPFHLNRSFRAQTGQSLWAYVLEARVDLSTRLLRQGQQSLLEISLCAGFQSYSQFVVAFRRHHRITPSQMRSQIASSSCRSR